MDEGRPSGSSPAAPWHSPGARAAPARSRTEPTRRRAGVVSRSLANVVDLGVVVLAVAAGYLGFAAVRFLIHPAAFSVPSPPGSLLLVIGLGVQLVYFAVTWAVTGATYGDRLLRLRVGGNGGARLGWSRSLLRAAACTIFPIGLLWAAVSRENRSLQDVLLRTAVVYET